MARNDTERLDWLQKNHVSLYAWGRSFVDGGWNTSKDVQLPKSWKPTVRETIDAAMDAEETEKANGDKQPDT